MAPAPVIPSSEAASSAASVFAVARDWWLMIVGGGFGVGLLAGLARGAWSGGAWKTAVDDDLARHDDAIKKLQASAADAAERHRMLEVAVAALPTRDEERELIAEFGAAQRAELEGLRADFRSLVGALTAPRP